MQGIFSNVQLENLHKMFFEAFMVHLVEMGLGVFPPPVHKDVSASSCL